MGIARSPYYDEPQGSADDTALVEAMHVIKDEFEAYGWRRMQAALGHRGWVVKHNTDAPGQGNGCALLPPVLLQCRDERAVGTSSSGRQPLGHIPPRTPVRISPVS